MNKLSDEDFVEPPDELVDAESDNEGLPRTLVSKPKRAKRTEVSEVSEFHATPVDGKVELFDLVKKLDSSKVEHTELKKRLRRVEKKEKVLDVPLNKHELEQITRAVQYEKTTKDVSLWEPIVKMNRKAEQLKFPLNDPDLKLHQTLGQFVQQSQPRTALEMQVAEVLKQNQPVIDAANHPLSKAEEAALRAMSLKEARLKRAELQRDRAKAAFVAAKLRMQGKIKSKKYHKVQRRSKQKQDNKKLDQMATDDPEAYRDWVQKAEKQRIQERVSLRHKGTSRFMQRQTRFGKYNMASRQAVQDMLQEGQTLRHKSAPAASQEIDDSSSDGGSDGEELVETTTRKSTLEDMEQHYSDEDVELSDVEPSDVIKEKVIHPQNKELKAKKAKVEPRIDPTQYMVLEKEKSSTQDSQSGGHGLALAFAGDEDVVADFLAEKRNVVERDRPKDIDLRLPGWGEWAGAGLTMSRRRKRRFIVKAPVGPARKDANFSNVIISEAKDTVIAKHQVNALPHPFNNVQDFERRIRQPVGRQWNTVSTFKKLTKPKIVTRLGKVITPIDKSHTFKKNTIEKKQQDSSRKNSSDRKRAHSK